MVRWHHKKHPTLAKKVPAKHKWLAFLKGFGSVLLLAAVFYSGFQVGNGSWVIHFGREAITDNQTLPDELDYSSVNEVYQALKQNYDGQLDVDTLITGLKKGLVAAAGDPYTAYLDADEATAFDEQLNGSFSGIGAELGKQGSYVVVIAPIRGCPAEAAGIKAGDIIIAIDDQDATNLSIDEAVTRIRGEAGTTVKLNILRGDSETLEFTITREVITIPSVTSEILDGNIGYIQISRFAEDTIGAFNAVAEDFAAANLNGIVLDLRNNPGGYLDGAVSVAGAWLTRGQVILEEKRAGVTVETYRADSNGLLAGIPTAILIDSGSASASEIVAGALRDNNAATIVGATSFGKGSVQEFSTFSAGDVLKITVARWYTPSGQNIDESGIEPDVVQELSDTDIANDIDSQLQAALSLLKS
jgi:carboxyl-terminal processing protease